MKICVVTDRRRGVRDNLPFCDVILFPFGTVGEIDYESELSGKTDVLERLAKFSGKRNCGVLCGCITDSHGLKRASVAAAASGRLLGIADMLNVLDGENFKSGAALGVYSMGGFKVGVCIGSDLFFPETARALSMSGCNLLAVHLLELVSEMPPVIVRAYAYLFGVPVVLCCGGVAYFADVTGVLVSSNREAAVFETSPKNCYRVITSRRRGIAGDEADDY